MKAEWTNKDILTQSETTGQSKSILVIDTPKNCPNCQLMVDGWCYGIPSKEEVQGKIKYLKRPSWCPIKTLPQKIEGKREKFMPTYSLGWNDCLDAVELGLKPLWEKQNEHK